MAYLEWKESLSVGVRVLDDDHKKLIDLINRVYLSMAQKDSHAVVGAVLAELVDYTKTHFGREERMMAAANYPDLESHRDTHRGLVRQVEDLQTRFRADPHASSAGEVFDFLSNWLMKHILGRDLRYKPFLAEAPGLD